MATIQNNSLVANTTPPNSALPAPTGGAMA